MRRTLLAALALCCFATTAHAAQGMNLRWDACLADGGVLNKDFACDANTGSHTLVVSCQLESTFVSVTGAEFTLNIATPSGAPSSWWQFRNTFTCRRTALIASLLPASPGSACADAWQGMASGGISSYAIPSSTNLNQFQLGVVMALPLASAQTLYSDQEYFLARITITNANTVGAGACAGCANPACLGLGYLRLYRPVGMGDLIVATETEPQSSVASWQGSPVISDLIHYDGPPPSGHHHDYRALACQATSRSQNRTWGSIKSLYQAKENHMRTVCFNPSSRCLSVTARRAGCEPALGRLHCGWWHPEQELRLQHEHRQ
jgi:hypothetical protein